MSGLSPIGPGAAAGQTSTLPVGMQQNLQNTAFGPTQFNASMMPAVSQLATNIMQNPYASGMQGGAATASQMGESAAQNQFSAGQNLLNQAPNLFSAGNQVFNTALDPQQQLYNRYLQNTEQQFQATNALSGVGSTPYAAGLNAQNLQNFNISWNAQQLQNQIAGLNAMSGAYGQGGALTQAGSGLQSGAAPLFMQSAALPYNTYNQIQGTGLGALQSAAGFNTGVQNQAQSLLGIQPALAGAQNQTASTQAALQQQMLNQLGGGIAGGLGLLTGGIGAMGGLGALGALGGGAAFGGGSLFSGDAYGGSSLSPLEGLTAEDYGIGY